MTFAHYVSRGAVLVLVALVAACTTYNLPGDESVPVEAPPPQVIVTPPASVPVPPQLHRPTSPSASAAWQPLLAKAQQACDRGDYEQAMALLERAQRIDPDSAAVYLGMARTHHAQGDSGQTRATAERGLLYCTTNAECDALRAFTR